jgi:diguanylate cyclase (GGDEF)-like protein
MAETWELADRVRSHVAGCSIMVDGSSVQVSLSLGVATAKTAADIDRLLHAADKALYQAKNAGRNRVEPSMGRAASASPSSSAADRDFWL